jgi:hypothetical protein
MSCFLCQNPTPSNQHFCSLQCARIVLAAVKEANPEVKQISTFNRTPYTKPQFERQPFQRQQYITPAISSSQPINIRPSYQDLLKQNQESVANDTVTNKCKNDKCPNQTSGNDLYCTTCDDSSDTKCKKCGVNDRNQPHPICTECHKLMKDKPKDKKDKSKYDKKDKSKYDKKDKTKTV